MAERCGKRERHRSIRVKACHFSWNSRLPRCVEVLPIPRRQKLRKVGIRFLSALIGPAAVEPVDHDADEGISFMVCGGVSVSDWKHARLGIRTLTGQGTAIVSVYGALCLGVVGLWMARACCTACCASAQLVRSDFKAPAP
ncbi:hypothetical protein L209DRAFT_755238 [Thermothelomyces heterothallicus CBS 203.75]